MFKDNEIKCYKNLPIDDANLDSYESAESVYLATQYINNMIVSKNCNVLIHGASEHTRSTTVLIAYLHVYQILPEWEDL